MESSKNIPSPARMEEYRRQMLEMSRRAAPPPPAPTPSPTEEDNWLDSRYPEPHFEQDWAAMAPVTEPETPPAEPAPPIAESPFVGYLRVFTFTANEAEPIQGARVTVRRRDALYANTETDRGWIHPRHPPTIR